MGFNGSLILARTRASATELLAVPESVEMWVGDPVDCPDGWRVLTVRPYGEELVDDPLVARLAWLTGAPVLVARVYRSDYAVVRGCAPGAEVWSLELNVRFVVEQAVWEAFGCTEEDEGITAEEWEECVSEVTERWERERAEAAQALRGWADAAGLPVTEDQAARAVEAEEVYAEDAVWEMFQRVGVAVPAE
ncbi:hypothetical protein AB0K51_25245 [Kitasatospora sp. NPDC049285]|uniref:hypothetical protein n=1 Tax=Kitasatospora sp. NPDC049285 TaxID=3157096 RepID=UPI003418E649